MPAAMSAALPRHAARIREAVAASGLLRLPGGDTLDRVLCLMAGGEADAALAALAALPTDAALAAPAALLRGLLLDAGGRRDAAERALAEAVGGDEASYDILCLAGDVLLEWMRPEAARRAYDQAIALAPHASHAWLRRGRAQAAAGDVSAAIDDLRRATLLQANLKEAHLALGDACRSAGLLADAIAAYSAALALAPDDLAARNGLDTEIATLVPPWHTAMLNDGRRNRAFDAAIRRAVARCAAETGRDAADIHVLDIGTGTGLLAMMAARAGAGQVTACEAVGPLAAVARDIVARNGFAGRIRVVHKRSSELMVGEDLPRPADLLVAEIVDAGLLNEGILAIVADARARLLKPGAAIVPQGATLYAMPIESAGIAAERRVDAAAGFDITPFNALRPRLYLQTDLAAYEWRPLAAPVELFRFDFRRDGPAGGAACFRLLPDSDGTAHAIAFWFRLALDAKTALATGPMDPPTHWKQAVLGLDPPVALRQGAPARLHARHDGQRIAMRLSNEDGE